MTALAPAFAVLLGCGFAAGVILIAAALPRWGAPSLVRRIGPYVRDVADPLGITPLTHVAERDIRRLAGALQVRLARRMGGSASIARRLRRADGPLDVVGFRARQLAWAAAGALAGALVAVALAVAGGAGVASILLPVVGGAAGALLPDVLLTRAANARVGRIAEELPNALEFLALCLAAGEGLREAVARVAETGGVFADELGRVTLAAQTGTPFADALAASSARLELPVWTRAVEHLVAALERGAPLAAVLERQAEDARDGARRALLEKAGRKEILMLLPLVFLILPLSVLFAIFPGVVMLRLGI
ncbi:type II secretion system F family protein [Microbacterium sp. X-17]|uniref:type II secretion system F family protein n=1 Tax=Microbacterium sp. X-17 TaxID=3144404 RepID=UPI0031F5CB90